MSVTSLVRIEMAVAMAAALALGLLLLALRPKDRASVRNTLVLLGLCGIAVAADSLMTSIGGRAAAAIAADIASVLAGFVLIRLATMFVFRVALPALRIEPARIAEDLAGAALLVAWGFVWLRLSGVDPTSLFATSAVITAVIAFAMQDTLGNVLGGVLLQVDRSIRVGDWVRIDDLSGQVAQIHWRHTAIETRNGETVVIPNGWLLKNRFTVLASRSEPAAPWRRWIRLDVDLCVPPGEVCAVLEEAVANARIANVAGNRPPSAVLLEVGARHGSYALRYWMHDRRPDDATDSVVRAHALAALARHGMKLGVPYSELLTVKDNRAHREAEQAHERLQRLDALAHVDLFAALTPAEREALADHLVYAPFVTGDVITRQGSVAHWLYLIIAGRVEVWIEERGERTRVSTLDAGGVFGEMGLMTGAPRRATVTALTDVVCYRLDKAGFESVLLARPDIAETVSGVLAERQVVLEGRRGAARGAERVTAHHDAILGRIREFFGLAPVARKRQAIVS